MYVWLSIDSSVVTVRRLSALLMGTSVVAVERDQSISLSRCFFFTTYCVLSIA